MDAFTIVSKYFGNKSGSYGTIQGIHYRINGSVLFLSAELNTLAK